MKKDPGKTPAKTVDEYLAVIAPEVRAVLEQLRMTIKAAAPEAEETISYQIPTYKYRGHWYTLSHGAAIAVSLL